MSTWNESPECACVDLISDVLPFGCLWYGEANAISNAISFATFNSGSHDAVIRVYDETGNVIEADERFPRILITSSRE